MYHAGDFRSLPDKIPLEFYIEYSSDVLSDNFFSSFSFVMKDLRARRSYLTMKQKQVHGNATYIGQMLLSTEYAARNNHQHHNSNSTTYFPIESIARSSSMVSHQKEKTGIL